jgi:nitroreductase
MLVLLFIIISRYADKRLVNGETMISKEEIQQAFTRRHATKSFEPNREIPDDEFSLILEAARLSPTSYGFEPWDIVLIDNKNIVQEIIDVGSWGAKRPAQNASKFIVMTAKRGEALEAFTSERISHVLKDIKKFDESGIKDYFAKYADWQKNDFALTSPELLHQWAARQAYIALGNMITVAMLRGVDSCPIEGFSVQRVAKLLENHKVIDIIQDLPVVMLALGYASESAPEKTRRPLDEIVTVL